MATSQEYLREIATKVDSIYSGALRDAADRLDELEAGKRNIRDKFAIGALPCATEIFMNYAPDDRVRPAGTEMTLARMAYIIADAMMEVRDETK